MSGTWDLMSLDNPVFRAYLFYTSLLVLKVLAMVHLTRLLRLRKKIFISHEDTIGHQDEGAVVSYDDPDIERVRRSASHEMRDLNIDLGFKQWLDNNVFKPKALVGSAQAFASEEGLTYRAHLNDLESIPPFLVASLTYILTDPDPTLAVNLMQLFAGARFAHTFVYAVLIIPQPARTAMFGTGFVITVYMALVSVLHFLF